MKLFEIIIKTDSDFYLMFNLCMLRIQETLHYYTAISIKVVPEQSEKVEYEREKLAGSDD